MSFWKNCFNILGTWEHLDTLGIVSLKFMLVQPSASPLALAWCRTPLRWDSWNFESPFEAAVRNHLPSGDGVRAKTKPFWGLTLPCVTDYPGCGKGTRLPCRVKLGTSRSGYLMPLPLRL